MKTKKNFPYWISLADRHWPCLEWGGIRLISGQSAAAVSTNNEETQPRIVVKFHDDVSIPYTDDIEDYLARHDLAPVDELRQEFPGIDFKRLFRSLEPDELGELANEADKRDPTYQPPDFRTYFVIECPPDVDPDEVTGAVASWEIVEYAYVQSGRPIPAAVSPSDDLKWPNQRYLDPAPEGIDAEFAWAVPGGDGTGIDFVDVEKGWTLNHEDIRNNVPLLNSDVGINSNLQDDRSHGAAVLGEVAALDNDLGCVGITPNLASVSVASAVSASNENLLADAVAKAAASLSPGDVLLIEIQIDNLNHWISKEFSETTFWPVEIDPAVYQAIRTATARGVVVVELAGNGENLSLSDAIGNDLDTITRPSEQGVPSAGEQVLNRNNPDEFLDSGAIMVGAASSTVPHRRLRYSNFGSRIDCYGWGENVTTLGYPTGMQTSTTAYTSSFNGTSSASAMVAGAAIATLGIDNAHERRIRRLEFPPIRFPFGRDIRFPSFIPFILRLILSNPANGTPSADPSNDKIGVMPNLRSIATNALGIPENPGFQTTKLRANESERQPADFFGRSVAIDGNIIVVGAPFGDPDSDRNDTGAVYVFTRQDGQWHQTQRLLANDRTVSDWFGWSVAIDGDQIVIGAPFADSRNRPRRGVIDGNLIVPEGPLTDNQTSIGTDIPTRLITDTGAAYVFTQQDNNQWAQSAKLAEGTVQIGGPIERDRQLSNRFGWSVAIDGNTIVVGAPFESIIPENQDNPNAEAAHVFTLQGNRWVQTQKLFDSMSREGQDRFGWSVAIDGNTIVVGAPLNDLIGDDVGATFFFNRQANRWVLNTVRPAPINRQLQTDDFFGGSVAVDGNTTIVGAAGNDNSHGTDAGAAYVFTQQDGTVQPFFLPPALVSNDRNRGDNLGVSVAIGRDAGNRTTIVVGAAGDDNMKGVDAGAAYVFTQQDGQWVQSTPPLLADDGGRGNYFGASVAIDEGRIVVGAPFNDESGSVYVFTSTVARRRGRQVTPL